MVQYTVHPLTKLSHKKGLRMTQVDQSWGLFDHQFFNATGEDHFLESKANVLQLRKLDSAVTFFAKTGAALTNSSPEGTTVSHCHTINHC